MSRKFLFFVCFIFLVILPSQVSAHLVGQPPFFRVNGVFSNFYSIPQGSYIALTPFPQDIGPTIYSTNTPIEFEFDIEALQKVVPLEIINKTNFVWSFGDGKGGSGTKNTHAYGKPGSYMVSITADTRAFEPNAEPQVIQSVLLHVVDTKEYVLPELKITVNGKEGRDPYIDPLEVNLKKEIVVEGSVVRNGTSPIVSYVWDFGDGQTAKGLQARHTYTSPSESSLIVLRAIDQEGFIVDTATGIMNNPSVYSVLNNPESVQVASKSASKSGFSWSIYAGIIVLLGGIVGGYYAHRRMKK